MTWQILRWMPANRDSLGSSKNKGGRKSAATKRPGPAPAEPAPKVSAPAKKRAKIEKANNKNQRRREDQLLFGDPKAKDPDKKAGLHKTVINSRGRTRGFFENCVFLTRFCEYESLLREFGGIVCCSPVHTFFRRVTCHSKTRGVSILLGHYGRNSQRVSVATLET